MNDYHKNKESPYLKYWCVNNLYGWAMSQKLPAKNYKEDSDFTMISQLQFSQWFTIFSWKNENSKSWITCSQLA